MNYNLLYYISYGLLWMLSLLPLRVLYLMADGMYLLIYYVVGYRKKMVRKNLTDSFPEKTAQEIIRIEKDFYRWFCDYLVETIKLLTISQKEIKRRMVFKNLETLNEVIATGQSVALYLGHYCNWEWITTIPLWMPPEVKFGHIYHALENADMDRLFLRLRERHGAESIPMASALRRLAEYRRDGQQVMIGYISDQVPFWNNIHHWLDFLHHDTPVLTGTERLVRRAGHAVFYAHITRPRRGYYVAELKLIARDPKATKDFELTDAYFRLLEQTIRQAPQFWLWTHNRWKRTHEEFSLRYDEQTGRVSLEPLETIKKRKGLL